MEEPCKYVGAGSIPIFGINQTLVKKGANDNERATTSAYWNGLKTRRLSKAELVR